MRTANDLTFDQLVTRYRKALTAAAYHLCGDREVAQDLVQETLLDAYRGLSGLRDSERAGAWLFTILRRKAADHYHRRKPELTLVEGMIPPSCDGTDNLVRDIVVEQLSKLPKDDREILAGKYLLGLSYRELADSLGISENTVGVRCFRAMERLREALRGAGVGVPQKRK